MHSILDVYDRLQLGDVEPISVDFIGRGNVWINNTYDTSVVKLAQKIILDAISNTSPGQLSIIGYDDDLSGIFAPFSVLSAGESRVLELITGKKEFIEYLSYMRQQIQLVQNVIQGRSDSLLEFRREIERPIEGYRLIVLSMDMGMLDNDVRAKLALLMRVGPQYGVSFLIISTTYMSVQTSSGKDIELSVSAIAPNIVVLETSGDTVSTLEGLRVRYTPFTAENIVFKCETYIEEVRTAQLPTVQFEELHAENEMWSKKSIDGLSCKIGKYGVNDMIVTIGDEVNQRHNIVITGAVGQGKSNLISVIVHSLCFNYSPQELQLYLLDFKEGVTFKAFSNIGHEEYLPHAVALGLDSDVDFGIAVLNTLFDEYENRMALLKDNDARSIKELRQKTGCIIPRIVVVIDEFQMMFGEDLQIGNKIGDLLEKSVRLYRAAGIHFVLASQTIGGNMALMQKKDSIFSQVPIRIALKNSVSESQQTLSINNPAAAFLRPREAVVNLDYGELSQNRKVVIAFADESKLRVIRKKWWESGKTKPPFVFESEKRIIIDIEEESLRNLINANSYPMVVLGKQISINNEFISIPLKNEPGRNIAIIGTPDRDYNQALGIIEGIVISLAAYYGDKENHPKFVICDFENNGAEKSPLKMLLEEVDRYGIKYEIVEHDSFEARIKELSQSNTGELIYVFGLSMDKWIPEEDLYGQGTVLKTLVEKGPSKGIHFIGWWVKASSFTSHISGFGNSDAFNTKVFLRIDERTVQSMTTPFVKWNAQNNRALVSDSIEMSKEVVFIPFSPMTE